MIDSDDTQQPTPVPRRNKVLDALVRAERKVFSRPAPKSAKAQIEFLYKQAKQSTKALAEQLGVSTRTVQRYRAGQQTKPQKKLQAALVEKTESQWQPQVRAQARERAATTGGMQVEVYAYFGFACTGSSDDGRERYISTAISPIYAKQILQLQEAGATEQQLHEVVADAITDSYFTEWGSRAKGLRADFTHVRSINLKF
ncbi:HTH domain-containing protein [Streptomyces sp. MBT62]|uniref:telomere-protecting terminal protein Tpg n=1 Tax=Streptomyces sp. MBT62 TaxID=2800410 RepID=UPI00190B3715|nr:HTH domain-containing protein [Streptomyces sp. MBT62]MBK3568968.1 HTH domain-containing protein [Streptomyces sp. MBT62]